MPKATVKFNGRDIELKPVLTTIGRTSDNDIAFPNDSNVSRYHAEIELRDGAFRLTDLGSSNGTTINGKPVIGEAPLNSGDTIVFGGSSAITIEIEKGAPPPAEEEPSFEFQPVAEMPSVGLSDAAQIAPAAKTSYTPILLAGAAFGLVAVLAIGVGAYFVMRGPACVAKAEITKPEPGETLYEATEIEVDVEDSGCVAKAIFTIDGVEFAATEEQPFTATIDPKENPDLADGFDHGIGVTLQDEDGTVVFQTAPVLLAFETRKVTAPPANTEVTRTNTQQPGQPNGKEVSLIDVQQMSQKLVKQFSGNFAYNVSNKQFLQEVQKRTAEYAQEGYFDRAARYRDAINVAYTREQNLDAALGFLLAMSRSKFDPAKSAQGEGLWKMSNEFVAANAYNGLCGTETLADPTQNCAAKASALYMKAIVFGVFDGDMIYSAAAFGKSPQDASSWKASLPANRADVWNSIKTPAEREQIVRFFAAGIVAENPQKFGLKKDKPLSELYRLTM
jgi:hypothetical protein